MKGVVQAMHGVAAEFACVCIALPSQWWVPTLTVGAYLDHSSRQEASGHRMLHHHDCQLSASEGLLPMPVQA